MPLQNYLFILLGSLLGSVIQSMTGFGYAVLCMALWPMVIPLRAAAVTEIVSGFCMVAVLAYTKRRYIRFRLVLWPILFSYIGSTIGVRLLTHGSETVFRRIFGGVLILLSIYFTLLQNRLHLSASPLFGALAGLAGGLLGGMLSVGGPPAAMYFLAVSKNKDEYLATLQFYFCLSSIYVFTMHLISGNVTVSLLPGIGFALAGLAGGLLLGRLLYRRMSLEAVRRATYGFMLCLGVYYVICG